MTMYGVEYWRNTGTSWVIEYKMVLASSIEDVTSKLGIPPEDLISYHRF